MGSKATIKRKLTKLRAKARGRAIGRTDGKGFPQAPLRQGYVITSGRRFDLGQMIETKDRDAAFRGYSFALREYPSAHLWRMDGSGQAVQLLPRPLKGLEYWEMTPAKLVDLSATSGSEG